jgi:DNA polymerase-3 subunit delta'
MSLTPLIGHEALRSRLDEQVSRGTLASSLLFTGPAGIGKQQLALWLAQRLLCDDAGSPCGICNHCKYVLDGVHPDLHWAFPIEGMKNTDAGLDEVYDYLRAGIAERLENGGVYAKPDGSYGIFLRIAQMLVQRASLSPAMAKRKVIVVGDAERMVAQASSDQAANAFLKLLEEPLPDTTVILTTSEPGNLLPTIRSRVIEIRVRPLADAEMREFLALPAAAELVKDKKVDELVKLGRGAPGALLDAESRETAAARAKLLLNVALRDHDRFYRVIYAQGSAKARGPFYDTLDAMSELLHARSREAAESGNAAVAAAHAKAMVFVEDAKRDTERNATPQLIAFRLLSRLTEVL